MSDLAPFIVRHVFEAPRARVFAAHTDPAELGRWFAPAGSALVSQHVDLRPGGRHHYGITYPDGRAVWGQQLYLEVERDQRIVLVQTFSDADGGLARAPMSDTWPLRIHATVTYEDAGPGRAELTVTWQPIEPTPAEAATFDGARDGMRAGFAAQFEALARYLATTAS